MIFEKPKAGSESYLFNIPTSSRRQAMKKTMLILGMAFAGYMGYALVEMTDRFVSL